jgi:AraC family transcriptional regulator
MLGISEFYLAQEDGGLPTTLAAGSAPGESGVAFLSERFHRGAHLSATLRRHLICFMSPVRIDYRIASRTLGQEPPAGSLAICPVGTDWPADAEESVDALLVAIDPGHLALAAAEDSALEAQLIECLPGYDPVLLALARKLALESADGYPNGPLFWNEVASGFIDGLAARHMSELKSRVRGMLGSEVVKQLRDYIVAHLDETIEVAALANIAGRSPFHFSRVFTRSVGVGAHKVLPWWQRISHEIDMAYAAWWVNSVFDPRIGAGFETGTRRITMSYFYLLEDLGIRLRFILHDWADAKAIWILANCRRAMKPNASVMASRPSFRKWAGTFRPPYPTRKFS